MQEFISGQRWINDAQLELGLGTVLSANQRSVTIVYLSTGETNTYALVSAPLTRVTFAIGDTINSHDEQTILVSQIEEDNGLIIYHGTVTEGKNQGEKIALPEALLSNFIQLNRPAERLFNGHIDKEKWFELRCNTQKQLNRLSHDKLRGLVGCRTSLIPHQLYIAHEVAKRYAPRVLLADEVGLGKTIEAGLILHHQLRSEMAKRVLIVVPESLIHQWLVEMLRRFNLMFHIFDEDRFEHEVAEALSLVNESDSELPAPTTTIDNPFHSEQLILCSLEFLSTHPERNQQCLDAGWDLLVVDEAHHLAWSEDNPSLEYQLIESLAKQTKGVLLLSATPEQLGKSSHFARLRLLDPDRFSNYDTFLKEEASYEPIAKAIEQLLANELLDDDALSTLQTLLANNTHADTLAMIQAPELCEQDASEIETAKQALIQYLLDSHGTGRILFRNTRMAIQGFPEREVHDYPLPYPVEYQKCSEQIKPVNDEDFNRLLTPERLYQAMVTDDAKEWVSFDPRINWLYDFLSSVGFNKILIITANANTAIELSANIRIKTGIYASVFHEGLSLVDRDRAAAWFADIDDGCQVLVCSEIGSEGRNFQFAHHLVLFDLPLNPDLLEQRIGRLDRIGQTETIHIHTPYFEQSAQAVLFEWYHHGLNAFDYTCPVAGNVYHHLKETIQQLMRFPKHSYESLLSETQHLHFQLNEALHKGRDKLLEYNSCRPHIAKALMEQAEESDDRTDLILYMEAIYDCFNINSEIHTDDSDIISPSRHAIATIPGLPEEGMTVTFERATALSNENMHFLTWDHPFVVNAMDLVTTSEHGNTAFTAIKHPDFVSGSILIEAIFILDTPNHQMLNSQRYLPKTSIRVVVDEQGREHSEHLDESIIRSMQNYVDRKTARRIVKLKEDSLRHILTLCNELISTKADAIIKASHASAKQLLRHEIDRLNDLHKINPNIRKEEIHFFELQNEAIDNVLDETKPRLDALRVIVTM